MTIEKDEVIGRAVWFVFVAPTMWGASKIVTLRAWWKSPNRRPLWQIPLILPLWLLYVPARAYVDWMDGK